MSKRSCPFDDTEQAIKKQEITNGANSKAREIRSKSSERTIQLLFKGASKQFEPQEPVQNGDVKHFARCFSCDTGLNAETKCFYCEKYICPNCTNICGCCCESHCKNCSFVLYDNCGCVCYSCYR